MVMMIVTDFERATYDPSTNIHLQYFFHVSAPALRNHRTERFWNTTVLQACQQNPCVRYLAVVVASLERTARTSKDSHDTHEDNEIQMIQYNTALNLMSTEKDVGVILIGCLMLVLLEDLRRAPFAALVHLRAGIKLLNDTPQIYMDRHLCAQLRSVFFALFQNQSELAATYIRIDSVYKQNAEKWPMCPGPGLDMNSPSRVIASLQHASDILESVRQSCVSSQPNTRPLSRFNVVPGVTEVLNDWLEDFNVFHSHLTHQQQELYKSDIHALRAYHLILKIASCAAAQNDESWYDYYDQDFDGLVKKFAIMCDLGCINLSPLLFFVACKYRDVAGRRRAIELLSYRVNGWGGTFLADIARKVVHLEEKGLDNPIASADIPESNRVRPKAILPASHSTSQTALSVLRSPFDLHARSLAVGLSASIDNVDITSKNLVCVRARTPSHPYWAKTNILQMLQSATNLVYSISQSPRMGQT